MEEEKDITATWFLRGIFREIEQEFHSKGTNINWLLENGINDASVDDRLYRSRLKGQLEGLALALAILEPRRNEIINNIYKFIPQSVDDVDDTLSKLNVEAFFELLGTDHEPKKDEDEELLPMR